MEAQTRLFQQEYGEDPDFSHTWSAIAPAIHALLPRYNKSMANKENRPQMAWNADRHGQLELFAS